MERSEAQVLPVPPDVGAAPRFDGPRIIAAAFVINAVCNGAAFGNYGIFMPVIAEEFALDGAQRMLGLSMLTIVGGLCGVPIGWAVDRGSLRLVLTTGVLAVATGLALISRATEAWHIAAAIALLVGVGAAMLMPIPVTTMVSNWYVRRRGVANGVAAIGGTSAGVVLPPLLTWLISLYGWRQTMLGLGIVAVAIVLPVIHTLVVKRPEDVGQHPDGRPGTREPIVEERESALRYLRQQRFWMLGIGMALAFSPTMIIMANAIALGTARGFTATQAAWVMSTVALFSVGGKLVFGPLVDAMDVRRVMVISLVGQLLGVIWMLQDAGYANLLGAAALYGLTMGGILPIWAGLMGRAFGRQNVGRAMGLMGPISTALNVMAPPLAGWLYQTYDQSFTVMFAPFLGGFVVSSVIILSVRFEDE